MLELSIDIIGWVGALLILAGYMTTSFPSLKISFKKYQVVNALGAVGMIINGAFYGAFPSAFLNIIWGGVAFLSLFPMFKKNSMGI